MVFTCVNGNSLEYFWDELQATQHKRQQTSVLTHLRPRGDAGPMKLVFTAGRRCNLIIDILQTDLALQIFKLAPTCGGLYRAIEGHVDTTPSIRGWGG